MSLQEEETAATSNPAIRGISSRRGVNLHHHENLALSDNISQEEDPNILSLRRKLHMVVEDLEEIHVAGLAALENPAQANIFKGMHLSAKGLFERFTALYDDLTDTIGLGEISDKERHLRRQAKQYYYGACGHAETLAAAASTAHNNSSLISNYCAARRRAKLPSINLPDFNGEITTWARFKATFESLVLNDQDLPPIDKFHYLVSALKGSALSVIADYSVDEANFLLAWQALLDNYEHPRLIATSYLDQLLNMVPLTSKPTNEKLRQTINLVVDQVSSFRRMEITNPEDFLLLYLARRCFDSQTREEFERLHIQDKFPSYNDFIKFLREKCAASQLATGIPVPTTVGQLRTSLRPPGAKAKALVAAPEISMDQPEPSLMEECQYSPKQRRKQGKSPSSSSLHQLQIHNKWRIPERNLAQNDLVLIKGEETDRQKWPLGRVSNVFPGADGVVRVAEILTSKGIFKRPVTKIIPLLHSEDQRINEEGTPSVTDD